MVSDDSCNEESTEKTDAEENRVICRMASLRSSVLQAVLKDRMLLRVVVITVLVFWGVSRF